MRAAAVLGIGLVALSCSRSKPSSKPTPSAAPSGDVGFGPRAELVPPAPPALTALTGPELLDKIRASGKKGVVVNIWASWCDPCRDELPMLARVSTKLEAQGVAIWLVSVDDPEAWPAAKAMLESLNVALPSYAAAPPLSEFKPALASSWRGAIPVSFLFDGTGKLRYSWPGAVFEEELVPIVDGFVAGKHIDGTANFGQKREPQ
jgi:cytochrome c biogenesis protein CcmG/thiol:disulfide interchange protein DsbE